MRSSSGPTIVLGGLVLASFLLVGYAIYEYDLGSPAEPAASQLALDDIPFNGTRSYEHLQAICNLGPRPSASPGMLRQQKMLADHFKALGGDVVFQNFRIRHPQNGTPVNMANLVVRWHPEATERILLCAHYDTRPFPDRDPRNPMGTFIGANDGASGVALLMELAHMIPLLDTKVGIDFALFDGEEFVFTERDTYFWGSEYFSRLYANTSPGYRYRWGVLLDMVADADLQIYQERNSMSWKDTRPLVESIWATARDLGVSEFVPRRKHTVNDDHVRLHEVGKIPACDIIDFDYPYWHTEADTADKCSALSLAKVGWVVHEWLKKEAVR